MSERQISVKKNILLNTIKSLLSFIFPLITFPYASRILLPDGIGKVNFSNYTVSIFALLANLGIGTYALREAAKIRNDKTRLSQFCSEIFALNLISMAVSYIWFFIIIIFVPKYHNYYELLFISASTIFFTTIGFDWLYGALEDYQYITLRSVIFQIISLGLLFIFVKKRSDYVAYCAIGVFSSVGSNLLNFFHSRQFIKLHRIDLREIKKHLKPVFILFGIAIAASIYSILDTNMLGFLSNDTEVGIYTAATKIVRISIGMLSAINGVLVPRLSYYAAEKNTGNYGTMLYKSINLISILSIPAMFGLLILSKPIVLVFCGNQYESAVPIMEVITPIVFFILSGGTLGDQIFTPYRKDKLNLYPVIAGAVINVILNSLLIPRYKALGAAIGTVAAECCVNILKFIFAHPYLKGKGYYKDIWKYFVSAVIMTIAIYLFCNIINRNFMQLIICIPMGIVIYGLCLYILRSSFFMYTLRTVLKFFRKRNLTSGG